MMNRRQFIGSAAALSPPARPSREAATRLYQRAGFQLRETNVYRVTLEKK